MQQLLSNLQNFLSGEQQHLLSCERDFFLGEFISFFPITVCCAGVSIFLTLLSNHCLLSRCTDFLSSDSECFRSVVQVGTVAACTQRNSGSKQAEEPTLKGKPMKHCIDLKCGSL